jgi:hypothetical protein
MAQWSLASPDTDSSYHHHHHHHHRRLLLDVIEVPQQEETTSWWWQTVLSHLPTLSSLWRNHVSNHSPRRRRRLGSLTTVTNRLQSDQTCTLAWLHQHPEAFPSARTRENRPKRQTYYRHTILMG